MELALNNDYLSGAVNFKDARLKTATLNIAKNLNASKEAFVKAGIELMKIQDDKLYAQDFFDGHGKPSFAMYVEQVLGISKTTAYRIMASTKKLLMPELVLHEKTEYFKNFSDSTLGVLANSKLGDYDGVKKFCDAYQITETTARGDVEKYIRAYTRGENPCMSLDEYIRECDSNKKSINVKHTDDNSDKCDVDTLITNTDDLEYAVQTAKILALIIDAIDDAVSTAEMNIISHFIKRFANK